MEPKDYGVACDITSDSNPSSLSLGSNRRSIGINLAPEVRVGLMVQAFGSHCSEM